MRKDHKQLFELLNCSGVTYDQNINAMVAPDHWWESRIRKREAYTKFRSMDCSEIYDVYTRLFRDTCNSDKYALTPTKMARMGGFLKKNGVAGPSNDTIHVSAEMSDASAGSDVNEKGSAMDVSQSRSGDKRRGNTSGWKQRKKKVAKEKLSKSAYRLASLGDDLRAEHAREYVTVSQVCHVMQFSNFSPFMVYNKDILRKHFFSRSTREMSLPSNYGGVVFSSVLEPNSDDEFDEDECIDMLEQDTIKWFTYCNILESAMLDYLARLRQPQPSCFPNICNGHMFMLDCLEQESGQICFQEFRMYPLMYTHFLYILRDNYGLRTENNIDVYEQVRMFLSILVHGKGYRQIQTRFEHSLYTVGRYFRKVLAVVVRLGAHVIKPNLNYNQSPLHHRPDPTKHRMFQDCIGVIDGTHIHVVLPGSDKLNFIGRK